MRARGVLLLVILVQGVDIVKTKLFFTQLFVNHMGQKSLDSFNSGVQLPGGGGCLDWCNGKLIPVLLSDAQAPLSPLCHTPVFIPVFIPV